MSSTDSSDSEKSNRNKPNQLLKFSGMAVQMGATIGLGAWAGTLLDEKYKPDKPYWTIALSLVGVFISLYLLIRQAKKMSDDAN